MAMLGSYGRSALLSAGLALATLSTAHAAAPQTRGYAISWFGIAAILAGQRLPGRGQPDVDRIL